MTFRRQTRQLCANPKTTNDLAKQQCSLGVGGEMTAYPLEPLGHPFLHPNPFNHPSLAVMDNLQLALEVRVLLPRNQIIQRMLANGEQLRSIPPAQQQFRFGANWRFLVSIWLRTR